MTAGELPVLQLHRRVCQHVLKSNYGWLGPVWRISGIFAVSTGTILRWPGGEWVGRQRLRVLTRELQGLRTRRNRQHHLSRNPFVRGPAGRRAAHDLRRVLLLCHPL